MEWQHTIVYEQPINEHIRTCLRLENLFDQLNHFYHDASDGHTRATINALLEIISLADRPDLRGVFNKEISRHHANLAKLQQSPNIDHSKLEEILAELEQIIHQLNSTTGKFAQNLRENEFLTTLKMYRSNPGGICAFDVPQYHYWLQTMKQQRVDDMHNWISNLELLQTCVYQLLNLIRGSSVPEFKTAEKGLYQMGLDPKTPFHLIRIALPRELNLYPETSIGRHRMFIRFMQPSQQAKPKQTNEDILFKLTCCAL